MGASVRPQALVLSPEAPYPPRGGGALRTSSIVDYLARRYNIDIITFREHPGDVRQFPSDRIRNSLVLDLPPHSRGTLARATRNLGRFVSGTPPLVDRFSGFADVVDEWLRNRVYHVTLVEHFWCAPYGDVLREHSERLTLDLHNLESALQATTASASSWPLSAMFNRFRAAYESLEREWLPRFDEVLVASRDDAARVRALAPAARVLVYPNVLPEQEQPQVDEEEAIVFSGDLAYHPNTTGIEWFASEIWPGLRAVYPKLEWRLIGKHPEAVRKRAEGMTLVGPVDDALPLLAATRAAVVPLRSGSGTRFKILEAWAAGRAVVSTTIGAEGLEARDREHLLIADTAVDFAAAVSLVLDDPALRSSLGAAGRKLYLERYTTQAGWRALENAGF